MKVSLLLFFMSFFFMTAAPAQLVQTERYEMEKENYDDYFTVVSADKHGLIIFRDTDEYRRGEGDIWHVVALDTALVEKWEHELAIDEEFIFKGYEVKDSRLFLLFRMNESATSSYHLITLEILDGEMKTFEIDNEIDLELSHLIVVDNYLILGGYVRHSPTIVSYNLKTNRVQVIPGFFKDRSSIVDLKANDNGTFNILTLEKNDVYHLRLRTYAPGGIVLFEKTIAMDDDIRVLDGKSTGFVDGNIVVTGTYGNPASYYSQGIYFVIVKPRGQENVVKLYNFSQFEHFFDYMGQRRADRIRKRIDKRLSRGREFKYSSRLLLHEVRKQNDGYLLAAEIYNPQFERIGGNGMYSPYGYGFGADNDFGRFAHTAHQKYVKRPGRLSHIDNANHFEYLQSVILKLDKTGSLSWDNSFPVEDVESYSLEKIVDFNAAGGIINLLYNTEETINYKVINQSETVETAQEKLLLKYENDAIKHTYEGIGGTRHWYGDYFYVWGYHRIGNKERSDIEDKRSVLYINKVLVEDL